MGLRGLKSSLKPKLYWEPEADENFSPDPQQHAQRPPPLELVDIYIDFIGDMKAGLSISEVACIVINSSEGIEVGTELAWEYSTTNEQAKMFIINMLDKSESDYTKVLNSLKKRFGRQIFPLMMPVNEGENFNPRTFINTVLTYVLKGHHKTLESGTFPPINLLHKIGGVNKLSNPAEMELDELKEGSYGHLSGKSVTLPINPVARPNVDALNQHRELAGL